MRDAQLVARWIATCDRADTACADPRVSADAYRRALHDQVAALHACRADGWTIDELDALRRQPSVRDSG